MRKETRKITASVDIYIAEDGKEFIDKWSCEDYELKLAQKKQENIASRLTFDTNGVDWPSIANPTGSEHEYKWFRLECDKDLNDFCQAYKDYSRDFKDPELVKLSLNGYPDYICLVDYPRGPEEPAWFTLSALLCQMNAFLTNIPEDDLYFMQISKDAVVTKVIELSKEELDKMNKFLTMTGKELYDKYGYKRDETFTWTANFGGGIEADIKLVICEEDEKPYCEGVLFHNGSEVCCTDGTTSELDGEWEFEYYGRTYVVEIKPEKDLFSTKTVPDVVYTNVIELSKKEFDKVNTILSLTEIELHDDMPCWSFNFQDGKRAVIRVIIDEEEKKFCLMGYLIEVVEDEEYVVECDVKEPENITGEWIFDYLNKRYIVDVKQEDDNAE